MATLLCGVVALAQSVVVAQAPASDALYRLPFDKGVGCVAHSLTPVRLGVAHYHHLMDFCAWEIVATEPTSVVAPREGVVEAVTDSSILIRHNEGIYTRLRGLRGISAKEGDSLEKGAEIALLGDDRGVWMEVFYLMPNPNYGTEALNGKVENLVYYINPIFSTRGKCKVQLRDGNPYTVKARTWCWPWE